MDKDPDEAFRIFVDHLDNLAARLAEKGDRNATRHSVIVDGQAVER